MKINGIWTFCLHPSTMKKEQFEAVESFLRTHKQEFIGFDDLDIKDLRSKDLFDCLLSWAYFTQRKLKGVH